MPLGLLLALQSLAKATGKRDPVEVLLRLPPPVLPWWLRQDG